MLQLGVPPSPLFLGRVEVVFHVAEELDFHDVYFSDRNPRYLGPRLIGVGVVIQDCLKRSEISFIVRNGDEARLTLVSEHEGHGEQTVFTTWLAFDIGILLLEAVYEQKGQKNDILSDLSSGQDCGHPLQEPGGGNSIGTECGPRPSRQCRIFNSIECCRGLKPEQTCDLSRKLGQAALAGTYGGR